MTYSWWRGMSLLTLTLLAAPVAVGQVKPAVAEKMGQENALAAAIQPSFKQGQLIRYDLRLSGRTIWTPQIRGLDWGRMATELTFTLRAKTPRADGGWTFDLLGERLRSAGETSKGRIDVLVSRQDSKLNARGKGSLTVSSDRSPLQKPMTLTLGPRGQIRFGTGLLPLAIYMLPHVDHRFWTLLTLAPDKPVAPHDQWEVDLALPLPGAKDTPLSVKGGWKVLGWEKYGPRDVLAIQLAAQLELKDFSVLLKNGDQIHVVTGSYTAAGKALWDVKSSLLCSATAQQKIFLTSDRPIRRTLQSQSKCSLELRGAQNPP